MRPDKTNLDVFCCTRLAYVDTLCPCCGRLEIGYEGVPKWEEAGGGDDRTVYKARLTCECGFSCNAWWVEEWFSFTGRGFKTVRVEVLS
jgi:hypothetical protein